MISKQLFFQFFSFFNQKMSNYTRTRAKVYKGQNYSIYKMPYDKLSDLPEMVSKLPTRAKKIFMSAFNSAYKDKSEEVAFKIAWSAVKQIYTKKGESWVLKSAVKTRTVLAKSGFILNPSYYIPVRITDTMPDTVGHRPTKELLNRLVTNKKIQMFGDVDHSKLFGDLRTNNLYQLIDYNFDGVELTGKLVMDKTHPKYKEMLSEHNKGKYVTLSAEFYDPIMDENGNIIDCSELGWTVTDDPENERAVMG